MNLVRHDLGLSNTDKRFPMKGTCLSIYSRVVNAEAPLGEVLDSFFPWCAEWEAELRKLFGAYVEAKQKQNVLDYDDLLLYWAQMMVARSGSRGRPGPTRTDCFDLSEPGALSDRVDARSTGCNE